jgi:hypothetical protein
MILRRPSCQCIYLGVSTHQLLNRLTDFYKIVKIIKAVVFLMPVVIRISRTSEAAPSCQINPLKTKRISFI